MKRLPVVAGVACLLAVACNPTVDNLPCPYGEIGNWCEFGYYYPPDVPSCDADACEPADVPGEGGDAVATPLATGQPCTAASQARCATSFCLTTDFVKALNPSLEVPGGMCSALGCSSDADCGGSPGVCVDASQIAGAPIQLCLQRCADTAECRYQSGYACFDTGLKDSADAEVSACLPDSLIAAVKCGDTVCDENEHVAGTCPLDCPGCGDGVCDASEVGTGYCLSDCLNCGDGTCDDQEKASGSCPEDCK